MTDIDVAREFVDRLKRVSEQGDYDLLRRICHQDVVIWHNHDGVAKSLSTVISAQRSIRHNFTELWFEDERVTMSQTGFVIQWYMCMTLTTSEQIRVPVCAVVTLTDGKIGRMDEYIDPTKAAPLFDLVKRNADSQSEPRPACALGRHGEAAQD